MLLASSNRLSKKGKEKKRRDMIVLLFLLHCFHVAHDDFHGLLQFVSWTKLPNLSSCFRNASVSWREIVCVPCLGDFFFPIVYKSQLTFHDDSPVGARV